MYDRALVAFPKVIASYNVQSNLLNHKAAQGLRFDYSTQHEQILHSTAFYGS